MDKSSASIEIIPLPAFSDNYLWLIQSGSLAWLVDPGDADVVEEALSKRKLSLKGILLTHHHADHVGGAARLQKHWRCPVYAPDSSQPSYQAMQTIPVHAGDTISLLPEDIISCEVLSLPGHTLDHVAYYVNQQHLFSGDVLFGAGCGRLFEGTPAQMYASLQQIAALPPETLVYPAHEYTAHNLAFAQTIEPDNRALLQRIATTRELRHQQRPSLPTSLAQELATNPFLRCEQLRLRPEFQSRSALEVFTEIRTRRNDF
ncbi:hydroxyacylglutathione hydrolase [Methylophilus glucosoxydans]|jgi:hydroxyacylglutathione hydrolase|uniref:Hydroxyacylglutathione hydrolase n=1 Tax=Methylophilus glucosoxydans TaxID=752553 RepID=A0ABW3GHP6_9PROT